MSRKPGESTEQWSARASAEYQVAWDALGFERRRVLMASSETGALVADEGYGGALDRLEGADCGRGDAVIALDRERRTGEQAERMGADVDRRVTDGHPAERPRRPVYEDFRDGKNVVNWSRFREAVASWDAAQAPPGSVQNPFDNLPGR